MSKKKKQPDKGLVTLLFVLIAIFLILVIVLMVMMFADKLTGEGLGRITPSPEVTDTVKNPKHDTPTPTPKQVKEEKPTDTPVPVTPTPTNTPTPAYSVSTGFGQALDISASAEYDALLAEDSSVTYEVFDNDYFASVLFTKGDGTLEPMVFEKASGKKISTEDFIRESYLAIVKERLQTYAPTVDENFNGTDFVTYSEVYRSSDYEKFYMNGDKLVFYFAENSLIEAGHKAFTFECSLAEAEAFMFTNTKGEIVGRNIRTDLDPNRPMVALTFDDGPHRPVEELFIDLLQQYDARITFFSVGDRFKWNQYPETLKRLSDIGCEICSHTFNHTLFYESHFQFSSDKQKEKNLKEFWTEINLCNLKIAETIGCAPNYIRMPGGCNAPYMSNVPMPMINWSLDTRDWEGHGSQTEVKDVWTNGDKKREETYQALLKVKDGDIVLMHSIYKYSFDATARAMEELAAQGYQFVNISELMYYKGITTENGVVYNKGRTN